MVNTERDETQMVELIEGVSPTRMELIMLRRRRDLAKKGHDLLREKQDALIMEFFDLLEDARRARREVEDRLRRAFQFLMVAKTSRGLLNTVSASLAVEDPWEVEVATRNIMGVSVPLVQLREGEVRRGYSLRDTSPKVDDAAKEFEECVKHVVRLAEVEASVRALADEIQRTKRRVSALEHILIPRLENTVKYITMHLEEMERESFFRLKRIKKRLEAEKVLSPGGV